MSNLSLKGLENANFSFWFLLVEFAVLAITTFFFWYPTPNPNSPPEFDREDWFWLLAVIGVVMLFRFVIRDRFWTRTFYDGWFIAFILLGLLNVKYAPYPSRGIMMLARPVLGLVWVYYLIELARETRSIKPVLIIMTVLGFFWGVVALASTQWVDKSADFLFIINHLPKLRFFFAAGGFNPNEIAGAMTWLIPLIASLILYPWHRGLQLFSAGAFSLLLFALMLGQSRAAIVGILPALVILVILLVKRARMRYITLLGIGILVAVQWMVLANAFPQVGRNIDNVPIEELGLSPRDGRSIGHRFDFWRSALDMVTDYPLTGVGMARFRYRPVRDDYPVPEFDYPTNPKDINFRRKGIPHTHNVFIQIATDLGIPGLIVFLGWNVMAVYMLGVVWQERGQIQRIIVGGLALSLVAQFIYSMGDVIPLWDRFSFIYWLLLGSIGAQFYLHKLNLQ